MRRARVVVFLALLVGSMSACASAPKPTDQMVATEAALRAAKEVGAGTDPQAQLHAKLAEEQLDRARQLMEDVENEEAQRMLERAKADAELALALSRKADLANEGGGMSSLQPTRVQQ